MSLLENSQYIEAAFQQLEELLEEGNWEMAHNLMAEVREEGFDADWKKMRELYNHYRWGEQ